MRGEVLCYKFGVDEWSEALFQSQTTDFARALSYFVNYSFPLIQPLMPSSVFFSFGLVVAVCERRVIPQEVKAWK